MQYLKKNDETFQLSFKDIFYEVEIKDKKSKDIKRKTIINNASGFMHSNQITSIMGPSGSGKTSLLNYLTGRIEFPKTAKTGGSIYFNSTQIGFEDISFYSGYVMQDDCLWEILTPYECFYYAAKLRKLVENDQLDEFVNSLLKDLQLVSCKDTQIGNQERKGVSGGERKRTSIGVELISNPVILFLDEPTSGLDSQTSFKIIKLLQKIASEKNMMIICTIHQPSSNIFNLFDQLIILEKGSLMYTGHPSKVNDYFDEIQRPLSSLANPADAFMRTLEENNVGSTPMYFIDRYTQGVKTTIDKAIVDTVEKNLTCHVNKKSLTSAGFCEATLVLSSRALKNVFRNPAMLRIRLANTIVFSFLSSSVFWQLDEKTEDGVYGRFGFFFFVAINVFMTQIFGTILSFPAERPVFIREYSARMYSCASYYLAKNLVETPLVCIISLLYLIILYFTVGLRLDFGQYIFIYFAGFLLQALCAQSLGYVIGSLFESTNSAMSGVNILILPFILFAGNLINEDSMPRWLFWIKYISPMKYATEIGNRNEFENNLSISLRNGTLSSDQIVATMNYDVGLNNCFIILSSMVVGYRIFGYFLLRSMIRKTG